MSFHLYLQNTHCVTSSSHEWSFFFFFWKKKLQFICLPRGLYLFLEEEKKIWFYINIQASLNMNIHFETEYLLISFWVLIIYNLIGLVFFFAFQKYFMVFIWLLNKTNENTSSLTVPIISNRFTIKWYEFEVIHPVCSIQNASN